MALALAGFWMAIVFNTCDYNHAISRKFSHYLNYLLLTTLFYLSQRNSLYEKAVQ